MDMLVTADPANIHHILSSNFSNYIRGPDFKEDFDAFGDGVITMDSELWKDLRKSYQAMIHHQGFQRFSMSTTASKLKEGLVPFLDHFAEEGTSVLMNVYGSVKMGNDAVAKVVGIGDICLETSVGTRVLLKGVKHVPHIRLNLIFTGKLDDEGFYSLFGGGKWKFTRGSIVMARGDKHSSFYWMQSKVSIYIVNAAENVDVLEL
ncbi:unnamed protein product [Arabis nemorensis]|uniref:Retrovirus-related Pol polyprotein from transposon TNT 1-94-like beta-barrel domain-containing protein n=1 Tax=Arabis nemorensis TaxID=586526 RepID=A0A565AW09_9BRAS|nr:unnamed protein product [Arabis nemorensis]